MQTDLPKAFLDTVQGARADAILRSCVHCGFCNATCPTYQLLGDELDGPRGRIYLIKEMLETGEAGDVTRRHLDRCLTCRACETTCPSGVRYGELAEIGRNYLEVAHPRRGGQKWLRRWLLAVVPRPRRLRFFARLGGMFGLFLPRRLRRQVPPVPARTAKLDRPAAGDECRGRVLLLQGCVQSASTPQVNEALAALLARRGYEVVTAPEEGCCGSLALHLGEERDAHAAMAANAAALDAVLEGVEAVISSASGCGVTVKDYQRLLESDETHQDAARRVSGRTRDAAEFLAALDTPWERREPWRRVAWQAPCTLQHGQQVRGLVEQLLTRAGYELVPVRDGHLCCGSAGTYSLLQPELAERLKHDKLEALEANEPDVIATANVGCQLHLGGESRVPVVHWVELLR